MKVCINCGTQVANDAKFCPSCGGSEFQPVQVQPTNQGMPNQAQTQYGQPVQNQGQPVQGQPQYGQTMPNQGQPMQGQPQQYGQQVPNQGHPIQGQPQYGQAMPNQSQPMQGQPQFGQPMQQQSVYGNAAKSVVNSATTKLNEFTGESGAVSINLKDLFSEVGKKHTNAEADEIFIAGTSKTTPDLKNVSETWGRPWLFSRFFMGSLVAFIALYFASTQWQVPTVSAGLVLIGAFAVPVTGLIFFFESNAFKNFSIFETLKVFFIGGVMAIFITLLLSIIIGGNDMSTWSGALTIGIVEEVGKLIIIVYFIRKYVVTHILNGLLIGAAVGAGFAAFETAGYIMTAWTSQATSLAFLGLGADGSDVLGITFARAWTALGTHMVWAAIAGGALIIAKRAAEFKMNQLMNKNFLVFFVIAIGLHTVWDKIAGSWIGMEAYIGLIALIVIAWIAVFTLMNAGLKEIAHMHEGQQ